MSKKDQQGVETDPRFPSGPWIGYYLQKAVEPGRHLMELKLTFRGGRMVGEGRDRVGRFTFDGVYSLDTGKCEMKKRYHRKHNVYYKGFNEGKGIWGTWEMPGVDDGSTLKGGFHIWPEDMGVPTLPHTAEHAEVPVQADVAQPSKKPELAPVGQVGCGPAVLGWGIPSIASFSSSVLIVASF